MKARKGPRIAVIYNRDFEGADADPENGSREDVKGTADHVMGVLGTSGYEVSGLGITSDVLGALATLRALQPVAVFNLCESILGDNRFESLLPLLLELEGIPFTGSGAFALSLALRKEKVKEVLRARSVPVPGGALFESPAGLGSLSLGFPLIVKPAREDASVGICSASVVHDQAALVDRVAYVVGYYRQPALVEQYIEGREIYVSVLDRPDGSPQVFPFHEIDFEDMPADRPKIVSFEAKWVEDSVEFKGTRPVLCTGLAEDTAARIAQTALEAFRGIGLRDYGRIDLRLAADGTPYVIDVNPNCDLCERAGGYSRAAKASGLSYEDVILRLVGLALSRRQDANTIPLGQRPHTPDAADRAGEGQPLSTRGGLLRVGAPRGRARSA